MNFVNYMKIKILNRLILHKDMFKSILNYTIFKNIDIDIAPLIQTLNELLMI